LLLFLKQKNRIDIHNSFAFFLFLIFF